VYRVLEATVAYATLICTFYYYYYYSTNVHPYSTQGENPIMACCNSNCFSFLPLFVVLDYQAQGRISLHVPRQSVHRFGGASHSQKIISL